MRAFATIGLVAGLATVVLPGPAFATTAGARPGDRAADVQYLVPNPGRWCVWYAQTQLDKAVGHTFTYVGLTGSAKDSSLACRMKAAGGAAAGPEYRVLVDFQQACTLQYPGTFAHNTATGAWYCARESPQGYDQSSRPMK